MEQIVVKPALVASQFLGQEIYSGDGGTEIKVTAAFSKLGCLVGVFIYLDGTKRRYTLPYSTILFHLSRINCSKFS